GDASVFIFISTLLSARYDHPELDAYIERAERLIQNETDNERQLAQVATLLPYYLWKGDTTKVGSLLERLSTSDSRPLVRLGEYRWKCLHAVMTGAADEALQAVTDGIALAEASGLHPVDLPLLCDGIRAQLCVGNLSEVRPMLERLSHASGHGHIKD